MRRILAALLLVPLALSLAFGQTRERITNGGFEEGTEGWTLKGAKLITDRKQARKGSHCVMGEVTAPKQACRIQRTLDLDANSIYRYTFWARGKKDPPKQEPGKFGIKTVLFVCNDAVKTRRSVGMVRGLPGRWRKSGFSFSVPTSGTYRVELIAPSSFGALLGKAWIDEISLMETKLPALVAVTSDDGFNERPALAVGGDGIGYCAAISFKDGKETIRVFRLDDMTAGAPRATPLPDIAPPGCEGVSRLDMAPAADGAWLVASCDVGGNWDIYAWKVGPEGAGEPVRVTTDTSTDINPTVAVAGGRVFVAWESNRSNPRQILLTELTDGAAGKPSEMASGDRANGYPDLAGDPSGRAWLVWHSFGDSNYDIYGARFDGQAWSAPRRLTTDPRIELRPQVAMGKDGTWLAWEAMTFRAYRTSAAAEQRVLAARIDETALKTTPDIDRLFPNFTQHPTLICDRDGRVWVAARNARERAGWDVLLRAFVGKAWSPVRPLTAKTGRAQHCPMATAGDRLLVGIQHDTVAGKYKSIEESVKETSNLSLASLDITEASPAETPALAALSLPETDFNMAPLRAQYGEDLPPRSITYRGETLHLYWGEFHEHSEISVCIRNGDLPPEDNYFYNRDIHKMDFCALTDHGYNLTAPMWNYLSKIVRVLDDPGVFVTFLGEEWTSTFEEYSKEHPFGFYGHRNLIFADPKFPRWFNAMDRAKPPEVWSELRKMKANFIHIPHQLADDGNVPVDWNYTDETAQPIAEIFQARQSYEYRGCPRQARNVVDREGYFIQDAWAKGVVIGVIASPDHGGGMGKAAVYAPELTREAILDACRARRTYGTSAAKIFIDFRLNDQLMGEKVKAEGGPIKLQVKVIGAGDIERVDVCRSNKFLYTKNPDGKECTFEFEDPDPLPGKSYYYVRVVQKDEELAWTSPVWVER